jgi:hypothetical protein
MTTTAPPIPELSTPPPVRRRRWPWLPRSWPQARAMLSAWWLGAAGGELRAAVQDAGRAPGWVLFGFVIVCWPVAGFSLAPIAAALAVWTLMAILGTPRRGGLLGLLRPPWWVRRHIRRTAGPLAAAAAILLLAVEAGPLGWGLSLGAWLVFGALTDNVRYRRRLLAWVLAGVADHARIDRRELHVEQAEWDGPRRRHLVSALVGHTGALRVEDQAGRDRVTTVVQWQLRHAGAYTVSWPAGARGFEVAAQPPLPDHVEDQHWPEGLPGIPTGVTDADAADAIYEERHEETGEPLQRLPLILDDPRREKHRLVVGGTGAGKTVFTRGFIARGLRMGWWPGGVYIFDGKSAADYIVFEGREGVRCVAREPEEWAENLPLVSGMMRHRYNEDVDYERGNRPEPKHPRYLVVLEEVQQIRSALGKDVIDPFLQQLSRQMRGSNGRLLVITQRPDTEDAIPGAVRDMLEDRYILGYVSATGARMVLETEWRAIVDEYGADTVPGRGVVRIGGRLRRFQALNIGTPRRDPASEALYPRRTGEAEREHQEAQTRAHTGRWAPAPAADDDQADAAAGGAHGGAEDGADGGFPQQPAGLGEPTPQRRRRTI